MARSLLQRRLANDRQRIAALDAALKNNHRRVKSCDYHEIALTLEWVSDHKLHLIRAAADWKPQLKTRDESRARLAAARHLFARFPAPAHLERIWLDAAGLDREEIAFRKACWFAVVSGVAVSARDVAFSVAAGNAHAFPHRAAGMTFAQSHEPTQSRVPTPKTWGWRAASRRRNSRWPISALSRSGATRPACSRRKRCRARRSTTSATSCSRVSPMIPASA